MAGFALHSLFGGMLFMTENDLTDRIRQRLHIVIARVAEIACFGHFLFVTRLTFGMRRQHTVGREYAFIDRVALSAFGTGFGMFGMGEFDEEFFVDRQLFASDDTAPPEHDESDDDDDRCQYREILFH
jgi:hypothetical protein